MKKTLFLLVVGILPLGLACTWPDQPTNSSPSSNNVNLSSPAPVKSSSALEVTVDFKEGKIINLIPQKSGVDFLFTEDPILVNNQRVTLQPNSQPQALVSSNYLVGSPDQYSPFGFLEVNYIRPDLTGRDPNANYLAQLQELGVKQVEGGGRRNPIWGEIQKSQASQYDWSGFDAIVKEYQSNNLYYIPWILSANAWDQASCHAGQQTKQGLPPALLPCDLVAYKKFVQLLVERYDGDGQSDMPGLRWGQHDWVVGNEPDFKLFWRDTPENFAKLFYTAYQAISSADSGARIHLGGSAGFYSQFLKAGEALPANFSEERDQRLAGADGFWWHFYQELTALGGTTLDFWVDQHYFGKIGDYVQLRYFITSWQQLHQVYGLVAPKFWSTEQGTFAGSVKLQSNQEIGGQIITQSEEGQAAELVKRYVYGLSLGIQKMFWSGLAGDDGQEGLFTHIPLVRADGDKKIAYGSLKRLAQLLNGGPLQVSRLEISDSRVYLFKIIRGADTFYVYWQEQDNNESLGSNSVGSQTKTNKAVNNTNINQPTAPLLSTSLDKCDFNHDGKVDEVEINICQKGFPKK